jgi:hypothetical protein
VTLSGTPGSTERGCIPIISELGDDCLWRGLNHGKGEKFFIQSSYKQLYGVVREFFSTLDSLQ